MGGYEGKRDARRETRAHGPQRPGPRSRGAGARAFWIPPPPSGRGIACARLRVYTVFPAPGARMRQTALPAYAEGPGHEVRRRHGRREGGAAAEPGQESRRRLGQYYTTNYNPFALEPFADWAGRAGLSDVLEPFAGANHIVEMLREAGWGRIRATSYDVRPGHAAVEQRDTIGSFPEGHRNCVSNPPWLGRSSAARRRLAYPRTRYDDLYKHCLGLALEHCENVAFLVPASFLHSGLFRERLHSVAFLHRLAFDGTENPTCLAMFHAGRAADTAVWHDGERVGMLGDLEEMLPPRPGPAAARLRFNDPRGRLGLMAVDDTRGPSIRFCRGADLPHAILRSSRSVTRIGGIDADDRTIGRLNRRLAEFREATHDVFLTPFKGLRGDGAYRRRLDYRLARRLIGAFAR